MRLTDLERAELAAKLIATLPSEMDDVTDAEVDRREEELASGVVAEISHQEFVRSVMSERRG